MDARLPRRVTARATHEVQPGSLTKLSQFVDAYN
jgi:hypothetical protein